ncbi:MAG: HAMP domain-containing sensor histidine kinase [Pseudomonadota bacterium]
MAKPVRQWLRIRRIQENLRLTRPMVVLAVGVLLPVLLSTSVGIVSLVLGESDVDIVLGALTVCFTAAAVGSGVVVTVLLGRRARTARLQSDLLGNVSHELKTPLAAIRMYAQTLQSGVVDREPAMAKQCVDAIVRETEWLGAMIERLLTWRGSARDRDDMDPVTEPIDGLVREVSARFSRMVQPGETDFRVRIDTALSVVHDRRGVGSVLVNLLTNAHKFTGAKKVISLTVEDRDGDVVIRVEDNGIGIPSRELRKIFEPFHRVESRSGTRPAGTGLGLAIVDLTVKAHGGAVRVESEEGRGTVFTVTLPAAAEGEGGK